MNKPRMIDRVCACGCGKEFQARAADVKRGWGLYASKSCKASHQKQTHKFSNGKSGRRVKGKPTKMGKQRGYDGKGNNSYYHGDINKAPAKKRAQVLIKALENETVSWEFFRMAYPESQKHLLPRDMVVEMDHEDAMDSCEMGWDAHKH